MQQEFLGNSSETLEPETVEELCEVVRWAESSKKPVVPCGHGAHAFQGNPAAKGTLLVSLRRQDQVLRYEPDDFTVGVQAGTPLATLRQTLRERGQEIALDLSRQARGTVGGLVATERPGPRRGRFGPVRASLIGMHSVRGGPSRYKSGGMVVKNVAGYEVARFLAGSFGTAGFLTEVNFKLRPIAGCRAMRVAACADAKTAWRLASRLRAAHLEPSALTVVSGRAIADLREHLGENLPPEDTVRLIVWLFEGSQASVGWQESQVDRLIGEETAPLNVSAALPPETVDTVLDWLCEFGELPGDSVPRDHGCVRLGALPGTAGELETQVLAAGAHAPRVSAADYGVLTDALTGLCTARWRAKPSDVAAPLPALKDTAEQLRGTAVLLYLPPAQRGQWNYLLLPDRARELATKLLNVFDPAGIFAPGRLHGAPETSATST